MNRREMLKSAATALAALTPAASAAAQRPAADATHNSIPRWELFELPLSGPSTGNPFTEVQLAATFTMGHRSVAVDGFYDGGGTYKLRPCRTRKASGVITPPTTPRRSTASPAHSPARLHSPGCMAPSESQHASLRLRRRHAILSIRHHLLCMDASVRPIAAASCRISPHRAHAFNKIRMCVFPKSYQYNHNEPPFYPFERDAAGKSDFTHLNPAFFAHIEKRIADLRAMNIEADLILFHPYDRWGYSTMPAETDDRYLRYIVARLSAHRNIW